MSTSNAKLHAAKVALEGLSIGDAVGEAMSYHYDRAREASDFSAFRDHTIHYTDDTEMAIAIYETLRVRNAVDENSLAFAYSNRYRSNPDRGYGRMARHILQKISIGEPWEEVSSSAFGGGSFGNGAAMRVAPLGAYYAGDPDRIPEIATRSARVTHYHPEGIAGAIAVAVATGAAQSNRGETKEKAVAAIQEIVLKQTPDGRVREGIASAWSMDTDSPRQVAIAVGNGAGISAQDTVPFCIWNATRCLDNFREAILSTIEVGGDCDTNCAIVGGIVATFIGLDSIPGEWLRVREPLDIGG